MGAADRALQLIQQKPRLAQSVHQFSAFECVAHPLRLLVLAHAAVYATHQHAQLAMSYPGVTKTYAIQAGRELRVIVGADKIDDKTTETLSADIAKKIQDEMTYPGQVKITVIRETRAVSYAR